MTHFPLEQFRIEDINSWADHPGGPRIVKAAPDGAGFDHAQLAASQRILALNGNMSSPTIAFILEDLLRTGGRTPCVMLGFGPGLTVEAGLFLSNVDHSKSRRNP